MHAIAISDKRVNYLKESSEVYGGFGWRKGKGKILELNYNLKKRKKKIYRNCPVGPYHQCHVSSWPTAFHFHICIAAWLYENFLEDVRWMRQCLTGITRPRSSFLLHTRLDVNPHPVNSHCLWWSSAAHETGDVAHTVTVLYPGDNGSRPSSTSSCFSVFLLFLGLSWKRVTHTYSQHLDQPWVFVLVNVCCKNVLLCPRLAPLVCYLTFLTWFLWKEL